MLFLIFNLLYLSTLGAAVLASATPILSPRPLFQGNDTSSSDGVSGDFFASLERLSRLVDITYCVGTTGIRQPFSCISRCKDFPSLKLATTWNTGVLLSDSCGYVAVDHGTPLPGGELVSVADEQRQSPHSSNSAIIVAFRGTYSITNTVVDLSTVPQKYVPYPSPDEGDGWAPKEPEHVCTNCTVHMGFLASWQIARGTVLPELKRLHKLYPNYPIHVVGHSLGGAVGALAALELKVILGWDNIIVTTFGEPRVGNTGFVTYLDAVFELKAEGINPEQWTYRRITHVEDPVPLLPLSEWGYRSHSGELFISKSELFPEPSDIRACAGNYDPKCIAGSEGEENKWSSNILAEKPLVEDTDIQSDGIWHVPTRYKLWELLFAHRDYFWRLGLCVPGGDPIYWSRNEEL